MILSVRHEFLEAQERCGARSVSYFVPQRRRCTPATLHPKPLVGRVAVNRNRYAFGEPHNRCAFGEPRSLDMRLLAQCRDLLGSVSYVVPRRRKCTPATLYPKPLVGRVAANHNRYVFGEPRSLGMQLLVHCRDYWGPVVWGIRIFSLLCPY